MRARGYDPKPGVLHKLFNSHYKGRSVAFSTASKWLRGLVLPEQDKLQVLATLFNMEPHVLRYGGKPRVGEGKLVWEVMAAPDRAMVDAYLGLPAAQRKLVRDLILALSRGAPKDA